MNRNIWYIANDIITNMIIRIIEHSTFIYDQLWELVKEAEKVAHTRIQEVIVTSFIRSLFITILLTSLFIHFLLLT